MSSITWFWLEINRARIRVDTTNQRRHGQKFAKKRGCAENVGSLCVIIYKERSARFRKFQRIWNPRAFFYRNAFLLRCSESIAGETVRENNTRSSFDEFPKLVDSIAQVGGVCCEVSDDPLDCRKIWTASNDFSCQNYPVGKNSDLSGGFHEAPSGLLGVPC